ncbi:aspartic peptidase domain-containing protein [Favolaschia claudopus]|uniref:Aspartic peptidase domain-containing protein n=1 Tax=Favolaschia claudopus TaxID=2862362 RepID=A0AAW0BLR2_9AGAR
MYLLSWLVSGSILSLFSPAYAEPVHLPLIRHVVPHSDSNVARSLLSVEQRNRVNVSLRNVSGLDLIPVSFGTPPQTIPLLLLLYEPETMVPGCAKGLGCSSGSTLFDYTNSSSAQNKSTSTKSISSFDSYYEGSVFTDVISFGTFSVLDASFSNIGQLGIGTPFGPVDNVGTFGLGFGSPDLPAVWQSLLSSNTVDAPEMGIWLSRLHNTSTSKAGTPGVFTFGGTNSSLYTGDIEFLNSASSSAWVLNLTTLTIQGHELTFPQSPNNVTQFDTSQWAIYGPSSSVASIWGQVPGSSVSLVYPGRNQYPCSTTLNVSVSFGGRSWTLDPAELNGGSDNLPSGQCLGAIIGLDESEDPPGWIFGEPFLRGVYTVLRSGNPPAVGFAELSEQGGGGQTFAVDIIPAPSPTLPSTSSSGSASSPPSSTAPLRSTPPTVSAKKPPVAAVAGGVIGGLILCAAILAALLVTRRRRRRNRPKLNLTDEAEGGINRDLTPEPFVTVDQHPEMAPLNSAQRRFKRKLRVDGGSGSAAGEGPSGGENGGSSSPAAVADVSIMEELRNLREEVRRLAERDHEGSIAPPSYHPDA